MHEWRLALGELHCAQSHYPRHLEARQHGDTVSLSPCCILMSLICVLLLIVIHPQFVVIALVVLLVLLLVLLFVGDVCDL